MYSDGHSDVKNAELENAQVINIIYELISDPEKFSELSSKIVSLSEIDPSLKLIEHALEKSAHIATQMASTPDVDLSRDIGVIVLGINRENKVSHTPPNLLSWKGARYNGDPSGIGWLEKNDSSRNIAHILEISAHDHLPVHNSLKHAFKTGQIAKLLVVHEFVLSQTAIKAFKGLYRLTDAEAQLCELLSKGFNLSECAEQSGVKKSTTRSHLKKVFYKLGVNNQSALIRILTQVSAASAIQEFSRKTNINLEPDWKNGLISQQTLTCQTRYGTQLTYSTYGDPNGKPVLFFHCGFGSRHHSRIMAEAAKKENILMYKFDRPGFGHSDILPDMSIKSISAVTEDFLNHLNLKSVDAIGFGVGGRTLLDSLQYLSGRILSANFYSFRGIINSPTGSLMKRLSYLIWTRPGILMNFIRIARLHSSQGIAANHLKEYFRDSSADREYLDDSTTLKQMLTEMHLSTRQDFRGSYIEHLNLKNQSPNFNQDGYKIPIKFIYGSDDPFNAYEDNEALIEKITDAQVFISKDHGQLHITHNLRQFLQSAFTPIEDCSWLQPIY